MAISCTRYSLTDGDNFFNGAKQAIDNCGLFTSSTISTVDDTKTLSVLSDSTEQIRIEQDLQSADMLDFSIYFRNGSGMTSISVSTSTSTLDNYALFIGTVSNSVIISFKAPTLLRSVVITPGQDGGFIIAHNGIVSADVTKYSIEVISNDSDSDTIYTDEFHQYENHKWTSLIGIAAHSASRNYIRTNSVYRMFTVQTGIPSITNSQAEYRKLTLDGFTYLTDGYFCLIDR